MNSRGEHHGRIWRIPRSGEWFLLCGCGMFYGSPTWRDTFARLVLHHKRVVAS